jgi:hypothetical protein
LFPAEKRTIELSLCVGIVNIEAREPIHESNVVMPKSQALQNASDKFLKLSAAEEWLVAADTDHSGVRVQALQEETVASK